MKRALPLAALLALSAFVFTAECPAQRQSQELPDGWKFLRQDADLAAPTDSWQTVTVPHCWNALDGETGPTAANPRGPFYYRGVGWYERPLDIPADWQGKRVFLRFEAASEIAQVYLNGHLLGEHRGSFTAFCFELTPFLKFGQPNELRVRLDNSLVQTVAPLAGDFNVNGGIYRPVHLIVTDPVCITPLYYASPGVFLTLRNLADDEALVEVRTLVSNGLGAVANVTANATASAAPPSAAPVAAEVVVEIHDASGTVVASKRATIGVAPGDAPQPVTQMLAIPHPHLWNGEKDPYLYTAVVQILRDGQTVDEVTQPLGLRTVAITDAQGFLLNGQPYPIHGVDRHQDMRDKGWALSPEDHQRDLKDMLDMGVTAIRLAHYPQSEYFHDLCDQAGMLLWNEVSFVNTVPRSRDDYPAFDANLEQQYHELILQRYNHPSVAFWGLFNELGRNPTSANALPEVERLDALAHELDRTRLTVCATNNFGLPTNFVADWPCYNFYPGWYSTFSANNTIGLLIDRAYAEQGNRRIALSEYGAGGNPDQFAEGDYTPPPGSPNQRALHPEEWQSYVHEQDWSQIKDNPKVWGSFMWVMFDFASAGRNEGGKAATNDKGMITQDRQIKKDVYYFYQANWTDQPMLYITSRRDTTRSLAQTTVKIYSNCPQVELFVNGKSLGTVSPNDIKIALWPNVTLQPGKNSIEADSTINGQKIQDSCEWTLVPPTTAGSATPAAPATAPAAAP